jgi:diacylglycerol kinase family enzyme
VAIDQAFGRVLVLINRDGGAAKTLAPEQFGSELEGLFRDRGVTATIRFLPGARLERRLRRAVEGGREPPDAIVVGGGDGTVSLAAHVLAGTGIPLGILPLGTLNHFAKDLRLPLVIDEAVAAICAASVRAVDVADVNGRTFVNNSSIGLYPYLVLDRDRRRSADKVSKWRGMAEAAWRGLRRLPARRLRITLPGNDRHHVRSPCLFVGNNDYSVSGTAMGSRSRLDGAALCLFVVTRSSRWTLLRLALGAVAGRLSADPDFDMYSGIGAVHVDSRASRLPVAIDGEVTVMRPPLQYRIRPQALHVIGPVAVDDADRPPV